MILKRGQISLNDVYLVNGSEAIYSSKSRRGMTMSTYQQIVFDCNLSKEKYNNLNVNRYTNIKIYHVRGIDKSKKIFYTIKSFKIL